MDRKVGTVTDALALLILSPFLLLFIAAMYIGMGLEWLGHRYFGFDEY